MVDNQVFVIGLDGATFDLIGPWVEQGHLPVLGRLMQEGAWGELRSTIHPITAAAWSSFITGVNPGKHGIFDFTRRQPGSYQFELVNATKRTAPSLWQMLNAVGRSTGIINVPMTYPPEAIDGYLVAGLDTPDLGSQYTYPVDLAQEIKDQHVISISTVGKSLRQYLDEALDTIDRRFDVLHYLTKRTPTDLTMKVIMETDAIQHLAWHLLDEPEQALSTAILDVYRRVDRRLGEFIQQLPAHATLFIMSDHGAGPIRKVVYLDNWLESLGLLRFAATGQSSVQQLLRETARSRLRALVFAAQRYLPQGLKDRLKRLVGVRSQIDSFLGYSQIDWAHTRVFSAGNQGNLFINLLGRDPQGLVSPGEEYQALRERLSRELLALRDPETGEPVVEAVHQREDLYRGTHVELAPDLLIRWADDEYVAKKEYNIPTDQLFGTRLTLGRYGSQHEMPQTGTHKLHGILIAWGQHIRPRTRLEGASIMDLAPTILHLMGVDLPGHLDGRVVEECLSESFLATRPPSQKPSTAASLPLPVEDPYSEEDKKLVQDRLRQLGYMA